MPPNLYMISMGDIKAAKYRLQVWGSRKTLDVKQMLKAKI